MGQSPEEIFSPYKVSNSNNEIVTKSAPLTSTQPLIDVKLRDEIAAQSAAHLAAGEKLFQSFDYEVARKELEQAVQL